MSERGNLYVVAAPSGAGKTTLVKALVESLPDITVSISHTTRAKRPMETHGVNYYFVDQNEFQRMVDNNEFLEHAIVFNHAYGTSRLWVEETLQRGIDVILEIDWQGAQQINKLFPECVTIYILPPSLEALSQRLTQRNQDHPEVIAQRLQDAKETISHVGEFDYLIVNDNFDSALEELKIIVIGRKISAYAPNEKTRKTTQRLQSLKNMIF